MRGIWGSHGGGWGLAVIAGEESLRAGKEGGGDGGEEGADRWGPRQ